MSDITLVIVDDQATVREALEIMLGLAEGIQVVATATNGIEAIAAVAEHNPDAIVKLAIDPKWGLCDYELRKALKQANIPKEARNQMGAMIKNLVKGHEQVVKTARGILSLADDADVQPTLDLLTQRLEIHEKTAWMLRSLLEK